jgi:hypothetical protein
MLPPYILSKRECGDKLLEIKVISDIDTLSPVKSTNATVPDLPVLATS